jgi:hypothetical protein
MMFPTRMFTVLQDGVFGLTSPKSFTTLSSGRHILLSMLRAVVILSTSWSHEPKITSVFPIAQVGAFVVLVSTTDIVQDKTA